MNIKATEISKGPQIKQMRKTISKKLLFIILVSSCISNSNEIRELTEPKMELYNQFNFEPNGQIRYQFYHEYGFTDKVSHLITLTKPVTEPKLMYNLPLDTVILKQLQKIDLRKFITNKPILFTVDYKVNSDVTIHAEHFLQLNSDLDVGHQKGNYTIEVKDGIETIRIYDANKKIEYLEQKK